MAGRCHKDNQGDMSAEPGPLKFESRPEGANGFQTSVRRETKEAQ